MYRYLIRCSMISLPNNSVMHVFIVFIILPWNSLMFNILQYSYDLILCTTVEHSSFFIYGIFRPRKMGPIFSIPLEICTVQ